jgi:predicted nucleic acid-binding protein
VTVVSNSSPIIVLASIDHINLLKQLYETVTIPNAVFQEITKYNLPGSKEVTSLDWFKRVSIKDRVKISTLEMELDRGEAEAIILSLELKADLLLIDERKGKLVADKFSIENIGVLGILIEAKYKKVIPAVKALLDDLLLKAGFWLDKRLYDFVLEKAGENKL